MFVSLILAFSFLLPASQQIPKVLFFTGGNSIMPVDIYSDFIGKLKKDYDVTIIKNSISDKSDAVIEQLFEQSGEKEIIAIGHSSGCTTLLNYCSKLKNVKKCILLDPVDNNLNSNTKLNYDNILQINAEKSYKWKTNKGLEFLKNPLPKIPFIPAFEMDTNKIFKDNNITKIEIKDYGHCDILDTAFSNIMHGSLAEGNDDRDSLNEYRNLLIELINVCINDETLSDDLKDEHSLKYNIDYTIN